MKGAVNAVDQEVRDRLRRMETRLVKLFEHLGLDTERKMPKWRVNAEGPEVEIFSMDTSIKDIIEVIPNGEDDVRVLHKGKLVGYVGSVV